MPGLSDQARFETLLVDGPRRPGASGDGQAAMALAIDLFERAGPRLGCRFVESCYLLALGDLRPNGSWNGFIREPQDTDGEVLDALNRELVPGGLSLHPAGTGRSWGLYSLGGLELRTRQCSFPWVPRYERSSWWEGFYLWRDRFWKACEEQFEPGWGWFDEGFMLGYPDQALLDYPSMKAAGWKGTVAAPLELADLYRCGLPNFLQWPESREDPDIQGVVSAWSQFLKCAYASPGHLQLRSRPDFLEARRLQEGEVRTGS